MTASIKKKISIVLLMILPLFFFSKTAIKPRHQESSIQLDLDKKKQETVDREIENYKSLIKLNLSEISYKLYLQEHPFKTVK